MWKPYIDINPIYFKSQGKYPSVSFDFQLFIGTAVISITILFITIGIGKYGNTGIYYRGQKLFKRKGK